MKLVAWAERRTPRDLWDLAAMADRGWLDAEAWSEARRIGAVVPDLIDRDLRSVAAWEDALSAQVSDLRTLGDAIGVVREARPG